MLYHSIICLLFSIPFNTGRRDQVQIRHQRWLELSDKNGRSTRDTETGLRLNENDGLQGVGNQKLNSTSTGGLAEGDHVHSTQHRVEATSVTKNCITVEWQVVQQLKVFDFELKFKQVGEDFQASISDKTKTGKQSYDVCNLNPNTQYVICVLLLNKTGVQVNNASCVRTETLDELSSTYIRSSIGAVACVIFIMIMIVLIRYCAYKHQQTKLLKARRGSRGSHSSFRERSASHLSAGTAARSPRIPPRMHQCHVDECDYFDMNCPECQAVAARHASFSSYGVVNSDVSPMLKRYYSVQYKGADRDRHRPRSRRDLVPTKAEVALPQMQHSIPHSESRRSSRASQTLSPLKPEYYSRSSDHIMPQDGAYLDAAGLPRRSAGSYREKRPRDLEVPELVPRRIAGSFHERIAYSPSVNRHSKQKHGLIPENSFELKPFEENQKPQNNLLKNQNLHLGARPKSGEIDIPFADEQDDNRTRTDIAMSSSVC